MYWAPARYQFCGIKLIKQGTSDLPPPQEIVQSDSLTCSSAETQQKLLQKHAVLCTIHLCLMKCRVFVFRHRSCVEERNAQMSKLTFGLCNASCRYHLYILYKSFIEIRMPPRASRGKRITLEHTLRHHFRTQPFCITLEHKIKHLMETPPYTHIRFTDRRETLEEKRVPKRDQHKKPPRMRIWLVSTMS